MDNIFEANACQVFSVQRDIVRSGGIVHFAFSSMQFVAQTYGVCGLSSVHSILLLASLTWRGVG